jgi:hypothetical protein
MNFIEFVDWAIKLIMVGSAAFVWKIYLTQNEAKVTSALTDKRIDDIEKFMEENAKSDTRISQLEKDVAKLERNMVTMETLKRVELYLENILERSGHTRKVDLTSRPHNDDKE